MAILELGINYGASYSLNFATDIISNREGIEQRRALYQQPLLKVAIGNRMVNKDELDYLLAFFEAAQGRLNEFEIRDWTDYQVTDGTLGPVIEGRQSVIKTYSLGGETIQRLLTAVVEETIVDDGGAISCEFNVPVRFDQDAFPLSFEAYSPDGERLFALQELTCTEVRKAWPEAPLQVPPASIDADLGIGKDYGTTGGQAYSTSIMTLPSGWDDRKANYSGSKSQWNIGSKIVNVAEMTRMIAMFRLCRGQLVPFNFYDWQTESTKLVRFDSDSLGLQFEAHDENYYGENIGDRESLFAINGLPVKAIAPTDIPGGGGGDPGGGGDSTWVDLFYTAKERPWSNVSGGWNGDFTSFFQGYLNSPKEFPLDAIPPPVMTFEFGNSSHDRTTSVTVQWEGTLIASISENDPATGLGRQMELTYQFFEVILNIPGDINGGYVVGSPIGAPVTLVSPEPEP